MNIFHHTSNSNKAKNKYTRVKPDIDDNEIKSEKNMIHLLVVGYIRISYRSLDELLPFELGQICIDYFGINGVDGILVVDKNQTHSLKGGSYQFGSILIKEGATLTVSDRNILDIISFGDITLQENAKIDLNGMGYPAKYQLSGNSYKGAGGISCFANYGGGGPSIWGVGGGGGEESGCGGGGGGGYGNYGGCCCCVGVTGCFLWWCCCCGVFGCCGEPGHKYGDKALTVLHLGSGGGAGGYTDRGGAGGGGLRLQCFGTISLDQNSQIVCNGGNGHGDGGGGSGGSIYIVINNQNNLKMNAGSKICAIGGRPCGGVGRIRIQFMTSTNMSMDELNEYDIMPEPYTK
eukprot:190287_1